MKLSLRDSLEARKEIDLDQQKAISSLYQGVYQDLKKQMEKLPKDGTTSQKIQKVYLNKLTKQLKQAYEETSAEVEKQIRGDMEKASQSVVSDLNKWASGVGLSVEGAFSQVPKDIVSMLSTGKVYPKGWTLSKATWGDSQQKAKDIDTILAKGVAANKSAYEIAKDLEDYVNPSAKKEWDWSKVYPGTSKKVDYNAQRLARTMVSHAYQQSLIATTKPNPFVTGIKWISGHTSRTCQLCISRSEDDQFGLGHGIFPKDQLPLDHPNGICSFAAVVPDSMDKVADRLADWVGGKSDPGLDSWFKAMYPNTPKKEIKEKVVKVSGIPTRASEILDKWGIPVEGIDDLSPEEQKSICRDLDKSMTWAKENIPGFSFSPSGTVSKIIFEKSMDCVGYIRANHTDVHLLADTYSKSVSTHEFVHATINMVMKKKGIPHYDYDARDKWVNEVRKEAFKKAELPNKKSNIKKYISDYAITSNEEFLAEAIGYGFYQRNPNTLTKSTIGAFLEAVRNAVT